MSIEQRKKDVLKQLSGIWEEYFNLVNEKDTVKLYTLKEDLTRWRERLIKIIGEYVNENEAKKFNNISLIDKKYTVDIWKSHFENKYLKELLSLTKSIDNHPEDYFSEQDNNDEYMNVKKEQNEVIDGEVSLHNASEKQFRGKIMRNIHSIYKKCESWAKNHPIILMFLGIILTYVFSSSERIVICMISLFTPLSNYYYKSIPGGTNVIIWMGFGIIFLILTKEPMRESASFRRLCILACLFSIMMATVAHNINNKSQKFIMKAYIIEPCITDKEYHKLLSDWYSISDKKDYSEVLGVLEAYRLKEKCIEK